MEDEFNAPGISGIKYTQTDIHCMQVVANSATVPSNQNLIRISALVQHEPAFQEQRATGDCIVIKHSSSHSVVIGCLPCSACCKDQLG